MHQLFVDFLNDITPNEGTIRLFKEIVKRTAAQKLSSANKELNKYKGEMSDIDRKLLEALDAFLDNKIDIEEKNRYTDALNFRRLELSKEVDELERNRNINESTVEYICNFINNFNCCCFFICNN